MSKMNPSVKARWVAALRSGEYGQTTQTLRTSSRDGYCCLGVLCDLYARDKSFVWDRLADLENTDEALPNNDVCAWAGFPFDEKIENDPHVSINGDRLRLSEHNDAGRTFAEIADAIEEQL